MRMANIPNAYEKIERDLGRLIDEAARDAQIWFERLSDMERLMGLCGFILILFCFDGYNGRNVFFVMEHKNKINVMFFFVVDHRNSVNITLLSMINIINVMPLLSWTTKTQ